MQINTNLTGMQVANLMRINGRALSKAFARIGTGLRIQSGADDPSGLGIASNMTSHINGLKVSMENVQDTINMIRMADGVLESVTNIVIRMRDLCIRLANQATLSNTATPSAMLPPVFSDSRIIRDEIVSLREEIERIANSTVYNGKTGLLYGEYSTGRQYSQIGPDNADSFRLNIVLPDLSGILTSMPVPFNPFEPASDATPSEWLDFATGILDDIDEKNAAIPLADRFGLPRLLQARADIGVLDNSLNAILDDLNSEYVAAMDARSRIMDADLAVEVTEMTRAKILNDAAISIMAQANISQQSVLSLLDSLKPFKLGVENTEKQ